VQEVRSTGLFDTLGRHGGALKFPLYASETQRNGLGRISWSCKSYSDAGDSAGVTVGVLLDDDEHDKDDSDEAEEVRRRKMILLTIVLLCLAAPRSPLCVTSSTRS